MTRRIYTSGQLGPGPVPGVSPGQTPPGFQSRRKGLPDIFSKICSGIIIFLSCLTHPEKIGISACSSKKFFRRPPHFKWLRTSFFQSSGYTAYTADFHIRRIHRIYKVYRISYIYGRASLTYTYNVIPHTCECVFSGWVAYAFIDFLRTIHTAQSYSIQGLFKLDLFVHSGMNRL